MIIELNNDSLTELKTYIKDCSAILKDTNNAIFYFNIENQKLEFYTQSVTSLTKFECHADFDSLDDNEYFVVNMKKFFAAVSKSSNNIKFIYTDNVLTFSYPDNNKSKIEVSTSDEVTKQEIEEIRNNFISTDSRYFKLFENYKTVKITDELLSFVKYVKKYSSILNISNAVSIENKNILKYSDNVSIISKTTKDEICEEDIYVSLNIFDACNSLFGTKIDELLISEDEKWVKVNYNNDYTMTAFIYMQDVKFQSPSEDDINYVCPDENNKVTLKFDKLSFRNMMELFDDIFDSTWQFKIANFESIENNMAKFTHIDESTNAESYLVCSEVNNYENAGFYIPLDVIKDIIECSNSEEFTLEYSDIYVGEEHGSFVNLYSDDIKSHICKVDV